MTRRAVELKGADSQFAQLPEQGDDFDGARSRLEHF